MFKHKYVKRSEVRTTKRGKRTLLVEANIPIVKGQPGYEWVKTDALLDASLRYMLKHKYNAFRVYEREDLATP